MVCLFLSGVLIIQNTGHFVLSAAEEDGSLSLAWHGAGQNKKLSPEEQFPLSVIHRPSILLPLQSVHPVVADKWSSAGLKYMTSSCVP